MKRKHTYSEGFENEFGDLMHTDQCRQGTRSKCICPKTIVQYTPTPKWTARAKTSRGNFIRFRVFRGGIIYKNHVNALIAEGGK